MKVIYIAGPYRDNRGEWHVIANIRAAEMEALQVWQRGGVALCPHKNTAGFGGAPGCSDDSIWLRGDLELLARCDAVWFIRYWEESIGAMNEHKFAEALNLPCLYTYQHMADYLLANKWSLA